MVVRYKKKADTGSNKPGSYAVQLIANAYWYLRPTGFSVSVLKPKIDRLSVTFDVGEKVARKKIRANLDALASDPNAPGIAKWPKNKGWGSVKYERSYRIGGGDGKFVLIQCAKQTASIAFIRIEFNPDMIGPDGTMEFRKLLPEITCGEVAYTALANAGKVTRLDIAVDLINIDLEDMLVSTAKPGVSMGYFGLSGKAETKYLNVKKKGSNLYIYDRKTHLQKLQEDGKGVGLEYGDAKHTRIEVRVYPNKPIVDLPYLKNPLAKIDLIDIEAAQPPEEVHHWKLFQDSCRYRGLAGALNLLPNNLKGQYTDAVKAVSGELWQPNELWKTWPEVIEKSGLLP